MSTSDSVWEYQSILSSKTSKAPKTPVVISVSAGTGGVTVTGPRTQPVINIPTRVTSLTAGNNIAITGTATDPIVGKSPTITLTEPLSLPSNGPPPTVASQLGWTRIMPLTTPSITNGNTVTFGTASASPGIYIITANIRITIQSATTVNFIQLTFNATNSSPPSSYQNTYVFPPYTFAVSNTVVPALCNVVTVNTTSNFTLRILCSFTGTGCSFNNRVYTITRIG
jgi:hypothetical protein